MCRQGKALTVTVRRPGSFGQRGQLLQQLPALLLLLSDRFLLLLHDLLQARFPPCPFGFLGLMLHPLHLFAALLLFQTECFRLRQILPGLPWRNGWR